MKAHRILPRFCALLILASAAAPAAVINISEPFGNSGVTPILYYRFDETSGATAADSSGNGYDGTLQNTWAPAPSFVAGKFGNALDIDGGTSPSKYSDYNSRVFRDASLAPNFANQSFTLGTWIRFDQWRQGVDESVTIFSKGVANTKDGGFTFSVEKASSLAASTGSIRLAVRNGISSTGTITLSPGLQTLNLNDGQWHQLGFSLEYDSVAGTLSAIFYHNGVALTPGSGAVTTTTILIGNKSVPFTLGEVNPSAGAYTSTFNGQMDDFFIASGVQTFAVPEPSAVGLTAFCLLGLFGFGRWRPRSKKGVDLAKD